MGFVVSFSFAFWETFYTGINGAFFSLYSLSPMLAALGVQTDNQGLLDTADWFTHGWGLFITGSVIDPCSWRTCSTAAPASISVGNDGRPTSPSPALR